MHISCKREQRKQKQKQNIGKEKPKEKKNVVLPPPAGDVADNGLKKQ